ncbi:MAG: hydrogenase expression/formation protein HypE [Elusimicrobia bacterium]|nr:hydrogenase expression/formation protein HypE [Elusimicrobiota bacterium]
MHNNEKILLTHGSGGRLTHELIQTLFKKKFSNKVLNSLDDAAELEIYQKKGERIAFTIDSFVVNPIFFPGGDIGKLAVCGTVNDLAMKGAIPKAIAISAIIEEGFSIEDLRKIVDSISITAKKAGVIVAAGDTKVVEKGKADKLFLTSAGIGIIEKNIYISGKNAVQGDDVIISGTIGDHGVAVIVARNDFKIKTSIKSDCAPLNNLVSQMLNVSKNIHSMRDPTRGGLATTLNEIAQTSNVGIIIEERDIPIKNEVKSVCNILGFDPLYVANEGKLIAIVKSTDSLELLKTMKNNEYGKDAKKIGKIVKTPKGVWLRTSVKGLRPLVMLEGEQLPRIC